MRFVPIAIIVASIAVPATAATFDVPARKAGQWKIEIIPDTKGAAPAMTTQICLDAESDKALMANGMAMAGGECQILSNTKSGDQTIIDSACTMGAMKTKSHIVMSGDFQSSYSVEITSDIESGPPKLPKHSVMTQNATYLGPCTNGMQPGDMLMPGGLKLNTLKALKPAG
jgi:hypothetical protein